MMSIKNHKLGDEEWFLEDIFQDSVSFCGESIDAVSGEIYPVVTLTVKDAEALAKHFGFKLVKEGE